MSKKDYVKIAAMLESMRASTAPMYDDDTLEAVVDRLVAVFQEDNPAFNPVRFRLATLPT